MCRRLSEEDRRKAVVVVAASSASRRSCQRKEERFESAMRLRGRAAEKWGELVDSPGEGRR